MTREILRSLLRERALRRGSFTLTSGKKSDLYLDGRLVTLSSAGAGAIATLMWERLQRYKPQAVGGMTLGADPIVGALLAHAASLGEDLAGFLVRKQPKSHGPYEARRVEGPRPEGEAPRVVVVEDTATTGGSALDAVRCVRAEWGAEVLAVLVVVDREEGAREALAAEGLPLESLLTLREVAY